MARIPDNAGISARQRRATAERSLTLAAAQEWLAARAAILLLAAGFGAGIVVRAYYAFRSSFPVNDGGLFYEMARDLQRSHFLVPEFTRYNGGEIPFVYPPLSLYLAALGDTLTPIALEEMFSILPFAGAVFALWALYRLATALFPQDRWTVAAATTAFALAPRSYIWLLMGGGLPRGIGLAFALLAAREAYLLTAGPYSRRRVIICGVFAALTTLTHLETAAFLALSFLVIACVRPREGFVRLAIAGGIAAACCAPWLASMAIVHGPGPFLAGMHEGGRLVEDGTINFSWAEAFLRSPVHTSEAYFPIIGALGLVGALYALARGEWLVPAWWAVTGIVGMRAFPTYVTVMTCLMAGYAIGQLVVPELSRRLGHAPARRQVVAAAAVGLAVFWLTTTAALSYNRGETRAFMESLSRNDRTAMTWVNRWMPEEVTFAVVPVDIWPADYPSEWFPALAGRVSVTTPQGYEWVPGAFEDRVAVHEALLGCASSDDTCLRAALTEIEVDYVYIPGPCCTALKASLRASRDFIVIYDHGAMIVASPEPGSPQADLPPSTAPLARVGDAKVDDSR